MANRIQFRRDTSANWTRVNPVLEDGEPGLEIDTNYIKYGDGNTAWVDLDYASTGGSTGGIGNLTIGENAETILSDNGNTFLNFNGFDGKLVIGSNADKNLLISLNENNTASEWEFSTDGNLTLPSGGTIKEGVVTSNPTIQLTPASPDVASQKLVIKGGGYYGNTQNGIELYTYTNTWFVDNSVIFYVESLDNANQTLYWWIHPEGAGISTTTAGNITLNGSGLGDFTFDLDSDDYEFTVRVSPTDNVYDPETIGVESVLMNGDAPTFADYHLHLTTGNLAETSIFLGTDDHNVRTTAGGNIQITTPGEVNQVWNFGTDGTLITPGNVTVGSGYGNISMVHTISANNFVYANGVSILSGLGSNYGNTEVAIYLASGEVQTARIHGNLTVGNLTVNGNITYIGTNSYVVTDNIVQFADGNPADTLDLGFVAHRTVGGTLQHTGLVRDSSAGNWKLFSNVTTQPGSTVDFTGVVYDDLVVGNITSPTINTINNTLANLTNYSNSNVASYLTTYSGNIGNVKTTANVITTGYFIGNGALLTGIVAGGGSNYSNANVASYLPTYSGNIANLTVTNTLTLTATKIALGSGAGKFGGQGDNSIAIGTSTGQNIQGNNSVALGGYAGQNNQKDDATAVGSNAGFMEQSLQAVAVGSSAGSSFQSMGGVAIGYASGQTAQGLRAVAIGTTAGNDHQGERSVAIGHNAGYSFQPANSIEINATGTALDYTNLTAGLYITSVKNDTANVSNAMYYNTTTKEITWGPAGSGSNYSNVNVATYLPTYSGNVANIRLGVSGVLTFPDGTTMITASAGGGSSYSNVNVAAYLTTYGGAIQSSNVQTTTANIQATTAATNPATGALRVMGGVGVAGTVFAGQLNTTGNLIANAISAYSLNTIANVTASVVNAGTINSTGNVLAQNLIGTIATASQTNITAVGTLATLSVTGNATVGNLIGTEANTRIIANTYVTTFDIYGNVTFPGNITVGGLGVTMPTRPAFRVNGTNLYGGAQSTANVNLRGVAVSTQYNQGNYFDATTGKFTAPVAGIYEVLLNARVNSSFNGLAQLVVLKNGLNTSGNIVAFWETTSNIAAATHFGVSGTVVLATGDYLSANILAGNITFDQNDNWSVTYLG